jgi:hypothetical protein
MGHGSPRYGVACVLCCPRVPGDDMDSLRAAFDWFFRSRETGKITVAQFPNLPLWIFLGAVAFERVVRPTGAVHSGVRILSTTSLGLWAADEVLRGVNPWRRILGAVVCVLVLMSAMSLAT